MHIVEVIYHYNYMIDFKIFFLKHISKYKICCSALFERNTVCMHWSSVGVCSTVVEQATHMHMRVYAGLRPTGADHCKELILALSCSLNDVK